MTIEQQGADPSSDTGLRLRREMFESYDKSAEYAKEPHEKMQGTFDEIKGLYRKIDEIYQRQEKQITTSNRITGKDASSFRKLREELVVGFKKLERQFIDGGSRIDESRVEAKKADIAAKQVDFSGYPQDLIRMLEKTGICQTLLTEMVCMFYAAREMLAIVDHVAKIVGFIANSTTNEGRRKK